MSKTTSQDGATHQYWRIVRLLRFVLGRWFRSVEVVGLEHVPRDRGGLIVSAHPNALLDPALILTTFPRPIVFGARDGLFRVPGLGRLMRGLGVVPIYRRMDVKAGEGDSVRDRNAESLDALAKALADGGYSCLFPEGNSHDTSRLLALKTGAARLYYRAVAAAGEGTSRPVIVPVGLHYDEKNSWRSRVLVEVHAPIELPAALASVPDHADDDARRDQARALTEVIEGALRSATRPTESWREHHLMHRARSLIRAERAAQVGADLSQAGIVEKAVGFQRVWEAYHRRLESHPVETRKLLWRVGEYDANLRSLGIDDEDLDRDPRMATPGLIFILMLQAVLVFLLLPPVLLVGYIVNGPAVLTLWAFSKLYAKRPKDEASIKVLLGAIMLPASWALAGTLAWLGHEQLELAFPRLPDRRLTAALTTVAFGILGGMLALRYQRLVRETSRALKVKSTRLRQKRTLEALKRERKNLHDALIALKGDLVLPGKVDAEGRVLRE